MSSYEERKQARIDRYQELAEKAARESGTLLNQAIGTLEPIPPGQPYVGAWGNRLRQRSDSQMRRSMEAAEKASYYAAKAEAAEHNNAISSDDPEALDKLTQKLSELIGKQERMKWANAYYRKYGTCRGCRGISDKLAEALDTAAKEEPLKRGQPYAPFELSNNNQQIHNVRERIKRLERDHKTGYVGWEFMGGQAIANQAENRLQLFFDEKPPEEQRKELHASGFVFSRENMAWQRKLNGNAIYAADRLLFIRPPSGELPSALQPKPPQREPEPLPAPPQATSHNKAQGEMRPESGRISPAVTVQDLLAVLEEAYPSVFTSDGLPIYLDALAKFSNYSYNNVLLICSSYPGAEHVEGFHTWSSMDRHVKRGEHGIKILAPCPIRDREEQDQPASQEQERKTVRTLFKVSTVFDVSQTGGGDPPGRYAGLSETEIPSFQAALSQIIPPGHTSPLEDLRPAVEAAVRERLESNNPTFSNRGAVTLMDSAPTDIEFEISAAAYVVCRRYGLPLPPLDVDTMQRRNWDTDSMKAALGCIRDTAVGLIEDLDMRVYGQVQDRPKDRALHTPKKHHGHKKSGPSRGREH